jgi:hypothetical protein
MYGLKPVPTSLYLRSPYLPSRTYPPAPSFGLFRILSRTLRGSKCRCRCPLCHEHRRYLPSEVFLGRLSHLMIRKPVRSADGRVG